MNHPPDLPLFIQWMDFLKWLLLTTDKFPKKLRFILSDRMNTLALNVVADLVEARYCTQKTPILRRMNLKLEQIRILLRVCYEQAICSLNEIGKMLGGWMKQQDHAKTKSPI